MTTQKVQKPGKLVAVGMRFIDGYEKLVADVSYQDSVVLRREDNLDGIDGISYAVYWADKKVCYVRNKDIPMLEAFVKDRHYFGCDIHGYYVSSKSVNYWVLSNDASVITVKRSNVPSDGYDISSEYNVKNLKQEIKMNTNSMRDSFFREVKNVAIDIQSGKFGVISQDGISVYNNGTVEVNPIQELGVKVPAFAVRVPVDQLAPGDIILSGNDATFFNIKTEQGYEVVTLSGEIKQVGQVSNMFFGKNTVLAVKNMFGSAGGMNPMMMAMLMGDDFGKGGDNKNLMMAMAMSGGMSGSEGMGGMNPMMLMMLMK